MGRRCKTCDHLKREAIEQDLLNNVTYRTIGTKYGISHVSIRRHFEHGHIAKDLVRATEVKKIAYSENLLDKLLYLQHEVLKILDEAKNPEEGKPPLLNTALSAIGKAAGMLETQAKLAGQLKELEVNIAVNPYWLAIKQEVFAILESYPDARKAMAEGVASGNLSSIEKNMIKAGDSELKGEVLSPAMLEIINSTLGIDPEEEHPNKGYQERLDREAKVKEVKPPVETKLLPTKRRS